jgi:hypothetical protein
MTAADLHSRAVPGAIAGTLGRAGIAVSVGCSNPACATNGAGPAGREARPLFASVQASPCASLVEEQRPQRVLRHEPSRLSVDGLERTGCELAVQRNRDGLA